MVIYIKAKILKTFTAGLAIACLLCPSALSAADYPQEYLGDGYREYLSGKIQNGYYIEVFTRMDMTQKERIDRRNEIEKLIVDAYQATPQSVNGILGLEYLKQFNAENLKREILTLRQQRLQNATAQGEFTYIPYSDGKIVYFTDGLPTKILNERVVDEFGNVNFKNTANMQYNGKRLLVSYDADFMDVLGNISHIYWYGAEYTDDSLFYATKDTNANKNMLKYTLKEIDPVGNIKETKWNAVGGYSGKLLSAFSQVIADSIYGIISFTRSHITYISNDPERVGSYHEEGIGADGLAYTLDRTDITYNDRQQVTGYHEELVTTQIDGSKSKTGVDAQFTYREVPNQFGQDVEEPDPGRLMASTIATTITNPDGSTRTEFTATSYNYDGANKLVSASGNTIFNGQEAMWLEYKDAQGHILSQYIDEDGKVTYSYIDPATNESVIVASEGVTTALKEGNKFSGTSEIRFEILADGKPIIKEVHTTTSYSSSEDNQLFKVEDTTTTYNNSLVTYIIEEGGAKSTFVKVQVLGNQEHTEVLYPFLDPDNSHKEMRDINLSYSYDNKGNLIDGQAFGTATGWEYSEERGWAFPYTSNITVDYEVILGKPLRKIYTEDKNYD